MKNIQNKLTILLFLILIFPSLNFAQDNLTTGPRFEINKINPYISITKEELKEANNIADLNKHYKASWIKDYISVEIMSSYKGKAIKSISKNATLSQEQKDLLNKSDAGANISIKVKYIPNNTLKNNDAKEINFAFTVLPESEATYPGGQEQLIQYLKAKAIDKIPSTSFNNYDLVAVKFTIDEEGKVINAHLFGSEYQETKDEKIAQLLLETIQNMPTWTAATYSTGTKAKQEFVLTVGNMENCIISLLNI